MNLKFPRLPYKMRFAGRSFYHETTRYNLMREAYSKGLLPIPEYKTRLGRIDLIWFDEIADVIHSAYEIDFSLKKKSLKKLRAIDCEEKKWIIIKKGKLPKKFGKIKVIQIQK